MHLWKMRGNCLESSHDEVTGGGATVGVMDEASDVVSWSVAEVFVFKFILRDRMLVSSLLKIFD